MIRPRIAAWLALISITLGSSGISAAPARPNILFILSDDHSCPFLGCYGRPEMHTPNLDRFAAAGWMSRRMFTSAPQCVPSRAAIMTGRSPVACRITRFSSPLAREEVTFPELLKKEAGYFVGVCGRSYHLDGSGRAPGPTEQVFEEHHLRTFQNRFDYVDASGQERLPQHLTEFFDQRPKDKPYFLWVNFSDPHHPWDTGRTPPDPAKLAVPGFLPDLPGVREDLSRYEGEIEHADGDFQRVLDLVKDRAGLENTLVIFMGDNGMAFPSGKGSLHDPGLNVPLLAWWPGVIQPGGDSSALISGEDIAPTCLEAAGVPVPQRISGVSFLPLLKGGPFPKERQHIFAERGPHGSATFDMNTAASAVDYSRCVRSASYKLIYNVTPYQRYAPVDSVGGPAWRDIVKAQEEKKLPPQFAEYWFTHPRPVYELYDLNKDPAELHNLYGQPGLEDITQELKNALQRKMILDFDYLPLPIAPAAKGKGKGKGKGEGNAAGEGESEGKDKGPGKNGQAAAKKGGPDPKRAEMFLKLDTDHDGKLSQAEFSAKRDPADAAKWFQARDVNGDGVVDQAEYLATRVPNPPKK